MSKKRLSRLFVPMLFLGAGLFTLMGMNSCNPDEEATQDLIDNLIKKAEALKDNTYSIQKKGGEAQVFNMPPEYSNWYVGTSYMDGTKQAIHVELMDEDEEQMTMGGFNGEIPLEVANKLTTVDQDFCNKYSWSYAKFYTMRLDQKDMLNAHIGKGGNERIGQ